MELQVLNAIQAVRNPFLDMLMPLISDALIIWFFLPAVLLFRRNVRAAGIVITAILIEVLLTNVVLKNVFQRVRPCDVNTAVTLLVKRPTDYSFPSGHTALSFAALTGLWLSGKLKRWRIPALIFACLIAFSRLYLYLHYPTDILMGAAVGIFSGWTADRLFRIFSGRWHTQEVIAWMR